VPGLCTVSAFFLSKSNTLLIAPPFPQVNPAAEDRRHSRSRSKSRDGGQDKDRDRDNRSRSRSRHGPKYKGRRSRSRSYSPSRSRSPRRRDHRDRDRGGGHYRRRSRSYSRSRSPRRDRDRGHVRDADEKKLLGDDDVTEEFIRVVAVEVKGRGDDYEATLKEKERGNPKYSFLTDHKVWGSLSPVCRHALLIPTSTSTASTGIIAHSCEAARR